MNKIYDCFLFFNELDLLELRLEILNNVIDKFVIVESTVTFTGKPKCLYFNENKHRFEKFKDKIIHIIINDTPNDFINLPYVDNVFNNNSLFKNKILKYVENSTGWNRSDKQWGREIYQRESIVYGLIDCSDDDIIFVSDLDEIPNPIEIEKLKPYNNKDVLEFKQTMYYYYFNLLKEYNWSGPKCLLWGNLKNLSINLIRQNKYTTKSIVDGGWHFSYMGGQESIKIKLDSFSHQEYNNLYIISNLENNIKNNIDPFFRSELIKVDIDSTYPKFLLENIEKYKYMIKE
jgi:beta-1,4-mannosyl-glycoprotein beta-1,4-N-acetylglucosaminyltransferase